MNKLRIAIKLHFFALLLLLTREAVAEHIIGGEVIYRCLNVDSLNQRTTFEIVFTLYRDARSGGAPFDPNGKFGVFRFNGAVWVHQQTINSPVRDIAAVDIVNDNPCIIAPPNLGVERGLYQFNITLPWSDQSYIISYQRCCRNSTINNIVDPRSTGGTYYTEITPTAQRSCNSSPNFINYPPILICANELLLFDHSAVDKDGDQLVYEFCAPFSGGGLDGSGMGTGTDPNSCTGVYPDPFRCPPPFEEVEFLLPNYSVVNPMGGDPRVSIDPNTGILRGVPTITGQFLIGVCVKEYRNGELIGEVRRDFQFNVTACQVALTAAIEAQVQNDGNFTINSCGSKTVDFQNLSTDQRYIQNYYWEFDLGTDTLIFNERNVTVNFPDTGTYKAVMILNRGLPSQVCIDTAFITVNVFPEVTADFSFAYDTCVAGPVSFTDLSVTGAVSLRSWQWSFDADGSDNVQNPNFLFRTPGVKMVKLETADVNNCVDSIVKPVSYQPVPALVVVDPSVFIGCRPASITFTNLSEPIDETYDILWDFGDGNFGTDISPTHIYEEEGVYSVKIEITSPIGCYKERSFPSLIRVLASPVAGFSFSPEMPNNFNREVQFIDESQRAVGVQWFFGSVGTNLERNPRYIFPDTGVFIVQQIAVHESGCTDTAFAVIDVQPLINLIFPNAFTPNNDGLNDGYKVYGFLEGIQSFKMSIYNRYGELIFNTEDPNEPWTGMVKNSGDIAPPGVYVYSVEFVGPRGNLEVVKGSISLIR